MSMGFSVECPKCHADRTMLETTFGIAGIPSGQPGTNGGEDNGMGCALPVRLILCVRCHYLEMYHDVGLGKLS